MRDTVSVAAQSKEEESRRRALFVTLSGFSNINAQIRSALSTEMPNVDFEEFSVSEAMRSDYSALFYCVAGALREYGFSTLRSKALLRYRLFRCRAYYETVKKLLDRRFGDQHFDFTLQTQSLFSAARPNCPSFVYTDHVARARLVEEGEPELGHPSNQWLDSEREIYATAAHVFTFGPKIRDLLVDTYDIGPSKVSAIGAGASVKPDLPLNTSRHRYARRNILFVGVDWERKGGPELVEAFRQLRKSLPDATMTIVGCSPEVDVEGCQVVGRLPMSQVKAYYHKASCFCMPSRVEPFGIVFLEAMQFGLPVVSTTVGDVGAIVQDGSTGRLASPRNPAELADALRFVLEDPERCRRIGLAGLERSKQFTWEAVIRRIAARVTVGSGRVGAEEVRW